MNDLMGLDPTLRDEAAKDEAPVCFGVGKSRSLPPSTSLRVRDDKQKRKSFKFPTIFGVVIRF
jgi:hypothetical protein